MKEIKRWVIYSVVSFILLTPYVFDLALWIKCVSISLIIGIILGMLNRIIIELKKWNKF